MNERMAITIAKAIIETKQRKSLAYSRQR